MMEKTGWSKATMSQLFTGKQGYTHKIVEEAARALDIMDYELLMHPDHANAVRQLRKEALKVVETTAPLMARSDRR